MAWQHGTLISPPKSLYTLYIYKYVQIFITSLLLYHCTSYIYKLECAITRLAPFYTASLSQRARARQGKARAHKNPKVREKAARDQSLRNSATHTHAHTQKSRLSLGARPKKKRLESLIIPPLDPSFHARRSRFPRVSDFTPDEPRARRVVDTDRVRV